jgi:hypothetical protein
MVKRFKQFNASNDKFIWRDGDIEHHRTDESLVEYTHDDPNPLKKKVKITTPKKGSPEHDSFMVHHNDLEPEHKKARDDYKKGSSTINNHLRENDGTVKAYTPEHQNYLEHRHQKIKLLDHVTSHKIEHHHTVYRGGIPHNEKKFPVGHEFTDHGYVSTSFRPRIATGFVDGSDSKTSYGKKIVHVIHVSPGTKGHYIDVNNDSAAHKGEHELLLHRGTRFKVTHHSEGPDAHYIHSRVVSQHKKKLPEIKYVGAD